MQVGISKFGISLLCNTIDLFFAGSDQSIFLISFYETYDKGSLLSRIDTVRADRSNFRVGLLHRRRDAATTADAVCSWGRPFEPLSFLMDFLDITHAARDFRGYNFGLKSFI
jgi:hypothetical protein